MADDSYTLKDVTDLLWLLGTEDFPSDEGIAVCDVCGRNDDHRHSGETYGNWFPVLDEA